LYPPDELPRPCVDRCGWPRYDDDEFEEYDEYDDEFRSSRGARPRWRGDSGDREL
jgi:hypothetical protein